MKKTLLAILTDLFNAAIHRAFPELSEEVAELTPAACETFGHYQCNSAMKLAKILREPPREVAAQLIAHLPKSEAIATTDVAGPGFINLRLSPVFVAQRVQEILASDRMGVPSLLHPQRIVVEFSSPNTAKEMHVGHLRSTIIGDALARVLEFLGHDVLRLSHVGDWGTQFGMLIGYIKQEAPEVLTGEQEVELPQLVAWYKAAKALFDEEAVFKKQAQLEVVHLQNGDPDSLKAWKKLCAISRKAYQQIYDLLDIALIERGESTYNPVLPEIIQDLDQKGLLTIDDGAKCLFLEGFTNRSGHPLPLIVQKADGGYNYATTDLAALRQRVDVEKVTRLIYVVDAGQATHFQMMFQAARKAAYYDPDRVEVIHVPFGLVRGVDGKKFRTREGETERLQDLLQAAIEGARAIVRERKLDFSTAEMEAIATAVGLGAVKYADLSAQRIKDYIFSYDRMLRFEGNTAPFLLYSYVRIAGIKRKGGFDVDEIAKTATITLAHPSELSLGLHLCRFPEVLLKIERDLMPHHLAEYLYALAERFNAFFRDCHVIGSPEEASRLLLCEATARVLKSGLGLLGIRTVERM